ncbi:hypothetical protein HDU76_000215, partial [Blyttiomyces sp. JEL0837]
MGGIRLDASTTTTTTTTTHMHSTVDVPAVEPADVSGNGHTASLNDQPLTTCVNSSIGLVQTLLVVINSSSFLNFLDDHPRSFVTLTASCRTLRTLYESHLRTYIKRTWSTTPATTEPGTELSDKISQLLAKCIDLNDHKAFKIIISALPPNHPARLHINRYANRLSIRWSHSTKEKLSMSEFLSVILASDQESQSFRKNCVLALNLGMLEGMLNQHIARGDLETVKLLFPYFYSEVDVDKNKELPDVIGLDSISDRAIVDRMDVIEYLWKMGIEIDEPEEESEEDSEEVSCKAPKSLIDFVFPRATSRASLEMTKKALMYGADLQLCTLPTKILAHVEGEEIIRGKKLVDILVDAGFRLDFASDDFIDEISSVWSKDYYSAVLVDHLLEVGDFDPVVFAKRFFAVKLGDGKTKFPELGDRKIATLDDAILSAALVSHYKLLAYLHRRNSGFPPSTSSQALLTCIQSIRGQERLWGDKTPKTCLFLLNKAKAIPSPSDISEMVTICLQYSQFDVLNRLIELQHVSLTQVANDILNVMEASSSRLQQSEKDYGGSEESLQEIIRWLLEHSGYHRQIVEQ